MNKYIFMLGLIFSLLTINPAFCDVFQGGVIKQGLNDGHKVIDSSTNAPISGARISLPQKNYDTYTDSQGRFDLESDIDGKTVMSVEKEGYKPYSVTVDKKSTAHAIVLGIEKSTPKDIAIETSMLHVGDNNFSDASANARDFQVKSVGPYYSKNFKVPSLASNAKTDLIIGSIIGIDTKMAKSMGQNKITNAYSSPPEIYFNGSKIAEIQVNGDGQKIRVPSNLVRPNQMNEVTIKTGRNLMQTAYTDYDDIEFMNLSIETR